jgi:hypothetical protein
MRETRADVDLTRRRGDAEKDAEKREASQNLRNRRKRRDRGWRHLLCIRVGAYYGGWQDISAHVTYASLRSPWLSADSVVSGFDFLNSVLRIFLRASASPRQRHSRLGSDFARLGAMA